MRIHPPKDQTNFEGWVAARFGWRLYGTFFKAYTEKVWGVPADQIEADWAAQRIKNLSLFSAVVNALLPNRNQKDIASLIEEFQYPKYGPGMMWEVCRDKVVAEGSTLNYEASVTGIRHADGVATHVIATHPDGTTETHEADHVVSSMPISALLAGMDPPVPDHVMAAANGLSYRDFITVALVVPEAKVDWNDNWIYIHDPAVATMRIQNFGSWSPYLVKDGSNVLGLEYTVFETDHAWTAPDDELIEQGKRELVYLGLIEPGDVEGGYVVRQKKAYPTYDETYKANVDVLRGWLEANTSNVHPIGRNGMFRYNNQDHSMYTAMLTAENHPDTPGAPGAPLAARRSAEFRRRHAVAAVQRSVSQRRRTPALRGPGQLARCAARPVPAGPVDHRDVPALPRHLPPAGASLSRVRHVVDRADRRHGRRRPARDLGADALPVRRGRRLRRRAVGPRLRRGRPPRPGRPRRK